MKNILLIFFIVLLFSPFASLCQTESDTAVPIYWNVRETEREKEIGPCPVIEANDSLDLCLTLFPLKKKNHKSFCADFGEEGLRIFWSDYSEGTDNSVISIRITKAMFEQIFKGQLEYRKVPASSHSGYIWQINVNSYTIPGRYKTIIETITTPDPQTGAC